MGRPTGERNRLSVPSSPERVPTSTAETVNRDLRESLAERLHYYGEHPEAIDGRLAELEEEWDIERVIEANAAVITLSAIGGGLWVWRGLFAVPVVVATFLLQHAIQGWCPPVPLLRRLGFRTRREIDAERDALRAIRDAT